MYGELSKRSGPSAAGCQSVTRARMLKTCEILHDLTRPLSQQREMVIIIYSGQDIYNSKGCKQSAEFGQIGGTLKRSTL